MIRLYLRSAGLHGGVFRRSPWNQSWTSWTFAEFIFEDVVEEKFAVAELVMEDVVVEEFIVAEFVVDFGWRTRS